MSNQIFWATLVLVNLISFTYHMGNGAMTLGYINLGLGAYSLYEARPVMEASK
jgi:hypothetical protein